MSKNHVQLFLFKFEIINLQIVKISPFIPNISTCVSIILQSIVSDVAKRLQGPPRN